MKCAIFQACAHPCEKVKVNQFSFRSFLIEEKCRFLSNFSLKTAEVELPGEFLLPKVYKF